MRYLITVLLLTTLLLVSFSQGPTRIHNQDAVSHSIDVRLVAGGPHRRYIYTHPAYYRYGYSRGYYRYRSGYYAPYGHHHYHYGHYGHYPGFGFGIFSYGFFNQPSGFGGSQKVGSAPADPIYPYDPFDGNRRNDVVPKRPAPDYSGSYYW